MKGKNLFICLFIAAIVALPQLLSAQTDYTITKDSVGNDHTLLRLEHQNGRYAEYMLEGNPDDISASFVDYINQDPLFENTTDDQLVATITLPAADLGFTPIEFCNVGDKLYCFGGNAVFQVDPSTSNILNVIPLSNAGSFFMQTIIQYIPANRFILGDASQNRLFLADLSNNFYIINTLTNQVVATHTLAAFTEQQSTCIGYNPDDDIVYWMVNSWEDGTVIKSYNALTGVELQSKSFAYQINDIMFTNDYLFICNIESDIFALNPNSLAVELSHYNNIYYRYHGFCFIDNSKIAVKGSFVGKSFFRLFSTTDLQLISTHGSIFPKDFLLDLVYNDVHDAINAVIIYAQDELETISYIETYQQNAQGIYARVNSQPVIGKPIYKVGCVPTSDYVFFSGGNYTNRISMVDFSIQQVHGTIEGCTSRHLFVNEMSGTEYVYSANPLEGTYSKHSNTTTALQNIKQTAFKTSSGCYNSQNNKLYFLNNRINYENSGVAIVDASTNSVSNVLQLGDYLTDIVYNENTNSIFVASRSEHKIFVLDGLTNSLISTIYVSDIPSKLFSAGSSVFCGGDQYIHVIDANTLNVTSHLIANDASFIQFEWNKEHGLIYGLFNTPDGFIAEINPSTGVLNRVVALGVAECSDLVYNDIENLIYVGGLLYPNVYVYDAHSLSQVNNISLSNDMSYGIDLEFDIYKNKVYANMKNAQYAGGNITAISCIDNTIVSSKVTHSPEEAISFNTINDQVYYNNMFINSEDRLEQCFSIDDCLDDVTENEVFSGNIFSRNYVLYYDFEDFEDFVDVFIPSTNMLYMPNGAFSNVSVIQCHNDYFEVEAGWNWLSFPRMERYLDGDFDSEAELSYLSIFPERYLKMHYKYPYLETYYKQFTPPNTWVGYLNNLNSTKGYKLRIGGSDDPMNMHLKGGKLEPETFMDLDASEPENWVGYFVEYPQLPQDCFSPATWDVLTSVVTRYWSIYKVEPSGGGSYWLGSGEITPFEYGDLVILTVDDDYSFSWVESDNQTESTSLPETAYYEFEEQASYVPYFIEMDSVSDAQEVAILADGEVKGAAVRVAGDTIIEVNAYLEDVAPDAEISLETWSGMKSSVADIKYSVFNQKTHRYENRAAIAGETTRYQLISMKKSVVETAPKPLPAEVTCFPNPFSDQVNFRIDMSVDASVRLEIRDVNGRLLAFVSEGKLNKGKHVLSWEGNTLSGESLSQGMYYYILFIDEQLCTSGKLIKH